MTTEPVFIAVDLGASSGRVMVGEILNDRISLAEIHRFASRAREEDGRLFWEEGHLFAEIENGLARVVDQYGVDRAYRIGVDSWGVDHGFLDEDGGLLASPRQYRDPRSRKAMEILGNEPGHNWLFEQTGVQSAFVNTSFHLYAEFNDERTAAAKAARQLLFMPDLVARRLCGSRVNERTIASTSQLQDLRTGKWSEAVIEALKLPREIFGDVVEPGTVLGPVVDRLARSMGVPDMQVVAVGGHDTASAVAAIPFRSPDHLFLSSGTWSIMGLVSPQPILSAEARARGFSNEGAVGGGVRFLRNLCGMWLIEECRREWQDGDDGPLAYGELVRLAEEAPPAESWIDPDAPLFVAPGPMEDRVRSYCRQTGQKEPADRASLLRMIFESLAVKYALVIAEIEQLRGSPVAGIHVVGGGSRNGLLNRMTADASGKPVLAGPVEATALGNLIVQMQAAGVVADLAEGRRLIERSFPLETVTPEGRFEIGKRVATMRNLPALES